MLGAHPAFDINNELWPIRPSKNNLPATKILGGEIINSIIAEGTVITKAKIINSIVRRGVIIEDGVEIRDSIVMDSVVLKKGCRLNKTIVDSYNIVEEGIKVGYDSKKPYFRASLDPSGVSVIASEKHTGKL